MRIKAGLRALATAAMLVGAGAMSTGVAHADDHPLPPLWRFVNMSTNQCLAPHVQGNYVGQARCDGSPAQYWHVRAVPTGGYIFDNAAALGCLRLIPNSGGAVETTATSCDENHTDASQSTVWWMDKDSNPGAIVSFAVNSGRPCLSAVGTAFVVANGCDTNLSWHHD